MLFAALGLCAPGAHAQSTSTGVVAGTVGNEAGEPLGNVRVELRPVDGGLSLESRTDQAGEFAFRLVEPGEYELLAERLGYRPVLLSPLPVRTAQRQDVTVTLWVAGETVDAPLAVRFVGAPLADGSVPGRSRLFGGWELGSIPQRVGDLGDMVRSATVGEASLEVEGLPSRMTSLVVDGVPFLPAVHGGDADPSMATLLVPTRGLRSAELLVGRPDVEWPGTAGSLLRAALPNGTEHAGGEVGGVWSGEAIAPDLEIPAGYIDFRAGGSGGGRLLQDSGYVRVFAEAQHHEPPVGYWTGRAGSAAAFDQAGVDVTDLVGPTAGVVERLNAGGAFGWRFPGERSVQVTALYGQAERDHALSGYSGLDVPLTAEGRDVLVAASGGGALTEQVGLQVRAGYGRSTREYAGRATVDTGLGAAAVVFVPGGVHLGGDPALPAVLERSTFAGQGTLHVWSAGHHVKLGGGVQVSSHERSHSFGREGVYLFGTPADLAARSGVFTGTAGPAVTASFTVPEFFAYGQDTWRLAPGLDLTTGLRYEMELLPADDLSPNQRWRELTGIDNTALSSSTSALGLVAGFDWNVRQRSQWRLRGAVAIQAGDVPADLLAEALTHDGRVTARGAVGDVASPATLGPRLTVLSPELDAPVTTRGSLGLSRTVGRTAALHLDGVIRQTVNLPARTDLNLPAVASYEDQYGRPVYGRLARTGGLIYPEPGSNRRFGEFDIVSGITGGASSTYWGVTAALEKRLGGLKAVASYTYSRTTDDWLAGGVHDALLGLPPFPADDEQRDWAEGTSDFDIPHRLVLAAELALPFAPLVTLGGFWRVESGRPFTPGFGRAIDANGDGIAGNDPAFVDESIEGIAELQQTWGCLRTSAARFVERNGCRHRTRSLLDFWLGLRLPGLGAVTPELRAEALALDGEGWDRWDTALYVVDPDGELVVDEGTGQVSVPLMVNPRFGDPTVPVRELARLRISLRMVF